MKLREQDLPHQDCEALACTLLQAVENLRGHRNMLRLFISKDGVNSVVVAFNSGGEMFFNTAFAQNGPGYWLVTMAHEMAHNITPFHNRDHEQAMEALLSDAYSRFLQ